MPSAGCRQPNAPSAQASACCKPGMSLQTLQGLQVRRAMLNCKLHAKDQALSTPCNTQKINGDWTQHGDLTEIAIQDFSGGDSWRYCCKRPAYAALSTHVPMPCTLVRLDSYVIFPYSLCWTNVAGMGHHNRMFVKLSGSLQSLVNCHANDESDPHVSHQLVLLPRARLVADVRRAHTAFICSLAFLSCFPSLVSGSFNVLCRKDSAAGPR